MRLGNVEVFPIVENSFKIDGGAMFGIIPRVIWEKLAHPDGFNRIVLDTNVFLVKASGRNILIDVGLGTALTEKQKKIFGLEKESQLESGLAALGLVPEDIDYVILSHLHADHAGGMVTLNNRGKKTPCFPGAKHVVQKSEWDEARAPDERTSATYFTDNIGLLEKDRLWHLVEGEVQILPEIRLIKSGGHTAGHQAVLVSSQGEHLFFPGDILPTVHHMKTAYVAGVDLYPVQTMKIKKEFLSRCLTQGWLIAFDHDIHIKVGRLKMADGQMRIERRM
jgi:glyoxylase-like metal-dependent hydrolase (beta-lactamase superfamily II)